MNTDYKQIEQLLERYWLAETSLQEEELLRKIFMEEDLPAHLARYRALFVYQTEAAEPCLSNDFEARIMAACQQLPVVKAKRITFAARIMPLCKAAAMIAVLWSVGFFLQKTLFSPAATEYDYNTYTDTYDDPGVAYKQVSSALQLLSEELNKSQERSVIDSIALNERSEIN